MEKILKAREMKHYDAATILAGTSAKVLMERAAAAVYDVLLKEFDTENVLILCGGGNNGGDGLGAARLLHMAGVQVQVAQLAAWEHLRGDAKNQAAIFSGRLFLFLFFTLRR